MKYTTQQLTQEQKDRIFNTHKNLLYMIFCCGGFMLRKQIKMLYFLLTGEEEMSIEFDISELICTGFLLQKTINSDTRTQMLYLSKYPKSLFLNKDSGDVAAVNWTSQKIFEQIFRVDYIIERVIPDMMKQDFEISMSNIMIFLTWTGSNLLLPNNQMGMVDFYNRVWDASANMNHALTNDFFRDLEIATHDRDCFFANQLKQGEPPATCKAKEQRDMEMRSYKSDIEKLKQFYSLRNFQAHNFFLEKVSHIGIDICFFDSMDSIQTKKLYQQLSYILLMFQRYTNNYNIHISCTVYLWDREIVERQKIEENKRAFDFYHQEWTTLSKKHKTMHDIGILPSNWENISVYYKSMEIFAKYSIHQ